MIVSPVDENERRSDIGWVLITEFAQWYGALGARGEIPRAFSGLTATGRQAIVILPGLPFDHVERREFLIWLCREEGIVAYVYGTHIAVADGDRQEERLELYASSPLLDLFSSFAVQRDDRDRIAYQAVEASAVEAGSEGSDAIFHGLQRNGGTIMPEAALRYAEVWSKVKRRSMWRERRSIQH